MVGFLLRAAISALGLWVASLVLPGIAFESPGKLAIAAVLLGLVNALVRPIAFILTLPLTLVTLGLFLFVLNAAMVGLVARLVPGLHDLRILDGDGRRGDRVAGVLARLQPDRLERPFGADRKVKFTARTRRSPSPRQRGSRAHPGVAPASTPRQGRPNRARSRSQD